MSDECLIAWKQRFPYYSVCQAVTRKFTLAGKAVEHGIAEATCAARYEQHFVFKNTHIKILIVNSR